MLIFLNADLSGRITEVPIVWKASDLESIFRQGGEALNVTFSPELIDRAIADCYENAGILQKLIIGTLDALDVDERPDVRIMVDDMGALEDASLAYAEQLNPLYQQFATRVASGIRTRTNSTGIYAHAMAVILNSSDEKLIRGLSLNEIYSIASEREPRIQKGNLRKILERFEALQVDDDGRNLVLAYNEATKEISVVDRQLLLYRKYATVGWPWEELIAEAALQTDGALLAHDE